MKARKISISQVCSLNQENITKNDDFDIIEYLDTGSITNNKIESTQILKIGIDEIPSRAKRKVKSNSIIYSTVRPNQEHFGFLENPPNNFIVSTGFTTIDVTDPDVDSKYIYYAITQKHITEYLQLIAENSVSSYPSINPSDLGNLFFLIPEQKSEQEKVSKILSALDVKIELNNRINAELEAMAKTLYDYWFVQFDFPFDFAQGKPGTNGKPYKTSGGRMVYNPTLKREIPEGWSVKTLGDVITRSGTGLNPRDNFKLGKGDNFYITIKDIEQGRINFSDKCDRVSDHALEVINKRSDLQKGDVLFTSIEPVGITYLLFEKPKNWNINESVFTLRANNSLITSEYLFMLLSSKETKAFCSNSSSGSVHKGIRHGVLKTISFSYAGLETIKEFSKLISPLLEKSHLIQIENRQLSELKDWLLPMLMNGQVTVQSATK